MITRFIVFVPRVEDWFFEFGRLIWFYVLWLVVSMLASVFLKVTHLNSYSNYNLSKHHWSWFLLLECYTL